MNNIEERIAARIIEALELSDYEAKSFPMEALLFGPPIADGLGLDSIASLEIISALAIEFDLPFDDIRHEDMMSVRTLAEYVDRHLAGPGRTEPAAAAGY